MTLLHHLFARPLFLIPVLLCLCLIQGWAQSPANETGWALAYERKDVQIYYRWVDRGEGFRGREAAREMRSAVEINASAEQIIKLFRDEKKLSKWIYGTEECKMLKQSDDSWTTYLLLDAPLPFAKRDAVVTYYREGVGNQITLDIVFTPEQYRRYKGISRMEDEEAIWTFSARPNGKTLVEFIALSFQEPYADTALQDAVLQDISYKTLMKLKKIAEKSGKN